MVDGNKTGSQEIAEWTMSIIFFFCKDLPTNGRFIVLYSQSITTKWNWQNNSSSYVNCTDVLIQMTGGLTLKWSVNGLTLTMCNMSYNKDKMKYLICEWISVLYIKHSKSSD